MPKTTLRILIIMALVVAAPAHSFAFGSTAKTEAKARALYAEGDELYQQGKYKEAEERFQQALGLLGEKGKTPAKGQPYDFWRWDKRMPTAKDEFKPRGYSAEYLISEGDMLRVFVWQNTDLTGDVTVQPDGRISFPLIGSLIVKGFTTTQVGNEISERLKEYVKAPNVSVSLKKMGSRKVIVLGEVKWPGSYTLTGATTVLEAIAMAQGFTNDSLASTIVILKGVYAGNPRVIRVSANLALRGYPEHNIVLESEDVVFVPKKPLSDAYWLSSEIMDPLQKGVLLGDSLHSRRW